MSEIPTWVNLIIAIVAIMIPAAIQLYSIFFKDSYISVSRRRDLLSKLAQKIKSTFQEDNTLKAINLPTLGTTQYPIGIHSHLRKLKKLAAQYNTFRSFFEDIVYSKLSNEINELNTLKSNNYVLLFKLKKELFKECFKNGLVEEKLVISFNSSTKNPNFQISKNSAITKQHDGSWKIVAEQINFIIRQDVV